MNQPPIKLEGKWTIRVPSVGGMPAEGMRICTEVQIYPNGPWVQFISDGKPMWLSRPCIMEPFREQRKSTDSGPRELPGLKEALAKSEVEDPLQPKRLRSVR